VCPLLSERPAFPGETKGDRGEGAGSDDREWLTNAAKGRRRRRRRKGWRGWRRWRGWRGGRALLPAESGHGPESCSLLDSLVSTCVESLRAKTSLSDLFVLSWCCAFQGRLKGADRALAPECTQLGCAGGVPFPLSVVRTRDRLVATRQKQLARRGVSYDLSQAPAVAVPFPCPWFIINRLRVCRNACTGVRQNGLYLARLMPWAPQMSDGPRIWPFTCELS